MYHDILVCTLRRTSDRGCMNGLGVVQDGELPDRMIPEHEDEDWLGDEDDSKGEKEAGMTRAIMGIADLKLPLKLGSLIGSSPMPYWTCVAVVHA
jgi:hypothetical protein